MGEQAVADVDHGGGAQRGGFRASMVGGSGRRCAAIDRPAPHARARRNTGGEQGQACGGMAQGTGGGHGITRARPQRVTGSRPCRSPRPVTASRTTSERATSPPATEAPARPRTRPRDPEPGQGRDSSAAPGGAAKATSSAVATAPMAATSARLRAAAQVPNVREAGPVQAEVQALQQEVRGGDDPAVRRGEHGGVVADPDDRPGPRPHAGRDRGDGDRQVTDAAVARADVALPMSPSPAAGNHQGPYPVNSGDLAL